MATPLRLSPAMGNRKLLTLAFVRHFIWRWGEGPSLSEIAAGTNTSKGTATQAVNALLASGALIRRPGPRGLSLPAPAATVSRADAIAALRDQGWTIDEDWEVADERGGTTSALPHLPRLFHPARDGGTGQHGSDNDVD